MLSYAAMSLWTDLLSTAVHAPSPHNVQPWRVRILDENEADLFIDSNRTLPREDLTGSFIILTMGMFIEARLATEGLDIAALGEPQSKFPILFVFGRADLTVPFYGAKIYPGDIEDIINTHHPLVKHINSFQITSYEDAQINRRLKIHLEVCKDLQVSCLQILRICSLQVCAR